MSMRTRVYIAWLKWVEQPLAKRMLDCPVGVDGTAPPVNPRELARRLMVAQRFGDLLARLAGQPCIHPAPCEKSHRRMAGHDGRKPRRHAGKLRCVVQEQWPFARTGWPTRRNHRLSNARPGSAAT